MDTVVIDDLIKGMTTPWPRLESDDYLMSAGSARPLEDAFRIAQLDTSCSGSQWIAGLPSWTLYQSLSQAVEAPLANVCDVTCTSVAKVRKSYLPGWASRYDVHERLRARAQRYLTGG